MPEQPPTIHDEGELREYLGNPAHTGSEHYVSTTLKTNERVIARVTDGIYRQPGSALRELIVNAYDADATRVTVKTDAPRFDRIEVSDNGQGMSPGVLAHLLFNIGGSAKRHEEGKFYGITSEKDSLYSPGGRRIIGKIGIGLFSVSQLTRSFQIITKKKGDNFRTVATIILKQYSDDADIEGDGKHKYESGKVNIWREKAADTESHGTTIVLTNIRPQARDTLRSRDIWSAIEQAENTPEQDDQRPIEPPRFHIGRVDSSGEMLLKAGDNYSSLPWDATDDPKTAFSKLVNSVWNEIGVTSPNPKLGDIFDYYLRMVWQLALSIPLHYVEGHLFDKCLYGWAEAFKISNTPKGQASRIELRDGVAIRDQLNLTEKADPLSGFEVLFDDLKLARPIKYEDLPVTRHAINNPLIFLGQCRETFPNRPSELSGGSLAFEAYLFWNPKIAPVEHQGTLVRIHGASGTLFDSSFMRYQVSEQTRLRQITCEIFVQEGLDSALNIDRESFNTAHPHAVFITKWLYAALRQLANTEKKIGKELRDADRQAGKQKTLSSLEKIVNEVWSKEMDEASEPPAVKLAAEKEPLEPRADTYVFNRSIVTPKQPASGSAQKQRESLLEKKLEAITQILASFGLLDSLPKHKQESLLRAIYRILDE